IVWRPDGQGLSYLQLEAMKGPDLLPAARTVAMSLYVPPIGHGPLLAAMVARSSTTAAKGQPRLDQILRWNAPFGKDDVTVVYATPHRITNLQYSDDCQTLFLTWTVDNQRQIVAVELSDPKKTVHVIHTSTAGRGGSDGVPATPNPAPAVIGDSDEQQPPAQPGRGRGSFRGGAGAGPARMTRPSRGTASNNVVRVSSTGDVYISGTDRSRGEGPSFPKPYIDKVNIKTGKKTRLFEGKGEMLETIDAVDGDDINLVFTTRQK